MRTVAFDGLLGLGMPVLGDRGFDAATFVHDLAMTGAQLLVRGRANSSATSSWSPPARDVRRRAGPTAMPARGTYG